MNCARAFLVAAAVVLLAALSGAGASRVAVDPIPMLPGFKWVSYKQCDPRWGSLVMKVPGATGRTATICQSGCAMTSASMMLATLGVQLGGELVNPGNLNAFLVANHGYLCIDNLCFNLNMTVLNTLTTQVRYIGEQQKNSFASMSRDIKNRAVFHLLHVRNKSHFVLATGVAGGSSFFVNDPAFNQTTYEWSGVADVIRYMYNPYRHYSQCNKSWGADYMGLANHTTICQVGCLMDSIASALTAPARGRPILLPSFGYPTPATLNKWLRANGGYWEQTSDLQESVVPKIDPRKIRWPGDGMHVKNDIPLSTIKEWLTRETPRIVIANVMAGQHFVLVVGWSDADGGDTLYINDSGFDRLTYSYSKDVVGWRIFDMK